MPITLVCGPPCSGKSTYVDEHAPPGATVICLDTIARSMGSPTQWMHDRQYTNLANDAVLQAINTARHSTTPTYIIRSLPRASERAALAQELDATVILLDPGMDECMERAIQDGRPKGTSKAIRLWYWAAAKDAQT